MTLLAIDPSRPYQEVSFDWAGETLRKAADDYIAAVAAAAAKQSAGFVPVDESLVDPSILEQYLAEGRDVGGIGSDRDISNVVPFNAPKVSGGITDRHIASLRRSFDFAFRREVARVFAPGSPQILFRAADYWYPRGGYMGWHTNAHFPGWRLYLTGAASPGRSFFRYRHPISGELVTSMDEGWKMRLFLVSATRPIWHAVYAGGDRFSMGYIVHPWSLVERVKRAGRDVLEWASA